MGEQNLSQEHTDDFVIISQHQERTPGTFWFIYLCTCDFPAIDGLHKSIYHPWNALVLQMRYRYYNIYISVFIAAGSKLSEFRITCVTRVESTNLILSFFE